jgi:hypothetical protein
MSELISEKRRFNGEGFVKRYKFEYDNRVEYHDKNRQLHRDGGPAVVRTNGTKEYWVHGKLHRTDGPAIEYESGGKIYIERGKRHRKGGPAVVYADGRKEYWEHGKRIG